MGCCKDSKLVLGIGNTFKAIKVANDLVDI